MSDLQVIEEEVPEPPKDDSGTQLHSLVWQWMSLMALSHRLCVTFMWDAWGLV